MIIVYYMMHNSEQPTYSKIKNFVSEKLFFSTLRVYVDSVPLVTHIPQVASEKKIRDAINQLKMDFYHLSELLLDSNLTLSLEKSHMVIFNKNNVKDVKLNNYEIKLSKMVKFLGTTLNNRLTKIPHIETIKAKCLFLLKILRCLRRVWQSADPDTILILFNSLVKSRLKYGFWISPNNKNCIEILQKIQNFSIRIALGYRSFTPVNDMSSESKGELIEYRFEFLCYKYFLKNLSYFPNQILHIIEDLLETSENLTFSLHNFKKSMILHYYKDAWYK